MRGSQQTQVASYACVHQSLENHLTLYFHNTKVNYQEKVDFNELYNDNRSCVKDLLC
jgi:hypothetical protein